MEKSPLISIVLPTYNRADLLSRSIQSAISQTYANWELIIWNDGSTDDTEAVVKTYGDQRIKYFYDENHGMSYALNKGIQKTQGEYIAFLDDDDQWTEHKLLHQLDILIRNPQADLAFGNFLNINLATGEQGIGFEQSIEAMRKLKTQRLDGHIFLIKENLFQGLSASNFIAFDTVVIRRDSINKAGTFNENLRNGMDFEYWWRLALMGGIFTYTNEVVLKRMKYSGSLSSPGILTCKNNLKCLDFCAQEAVSKGRSDLLSHLDGPYRSTWQNMIPLFARAGDRAGVLRAFGQSLRYGFQPGSIRLLLQALWIFQFANKMMGR